MNSIGLDGWDNPAGCALRQKHPSFLEGVTTREKVVTTRSQGERLCLGVKESMVGSCIQAQGRGTLAWGTTTSEALLQGALLCNLHSSAFYCILSKSSWLMGLSWLTMGSWAWQAQVPLAEGLLGAC